MRRLLLVACLAWSATVSSASSWASPGLTLQLTSADPVVVRGRYFKPLELVRVTLAVDAVKRARVVRSSSGGSFRLTFAPLAIDRCNSDVYLRAVGARGSRASVKLPQLLCPPTLRRP